MRVTVTHVVGGQLADHPVKLTPVGPRARHLLAVDLGAARAARRRVLLVDGLSSLLAAWRAARLS
jgi:hypothetical protein